MLQNIGPFERKKTQDFLLDLSNSTVHVGAGNVIMFSNSNITAMTLHSFIYVLCSYASICLNAGAVYAVQGAIRP